MVRFSLSSPTSGYDYNGVPKFVKHPRTLDGSLGHFRRKNAGCYCIHYAETFVALWARASPREFDEAAYTLDVVHDRAVGSTCLGEQAEEGDGEKIGRKRVDPIQLCPLLGSLILEQGHSESLGVRAHRGVFMMLEFRLGSDLSSAEVLVGVCSESRREGSRAFWQGCIVSR